MTALDCPLLSLCPAPFPIPSWQRPRSQLSQATPSSWCWRGTSPSLQPKIAPCLFSGGAVSLATHTSPPCFEGGVEKVWWSFISPCCTWKLYIFLIINSQMSFYWGFWPIELKVFWFKTVYIDFDNIGKRKPLFFSPLKIVRPLKPVSMVIS